MNYESPLVRVEFEYANGSIQFLTGESADAWLEDVNTAVTASRSTGPLRNYQWEWINRSPLQKKKLLAEWYENYDGLD